MKTKISKPTLNAAEEKQKNIQNPHDALFKSMCKNRDVTIDLLREALPQALFAQIQLESLTLTDKSFVSSQLKHQHSDIVYQAHINGHEGYIVFLLEHQSTDDALT